MASKFNLKAAIRAVNENGMLLVFPLNNRKDPRSLWSVFYPRSEMIWEWDEGGDTRVSDLWHLREELSRSGKVVYSKFYQGRATLFSREVFAQALSAAQRGALASTEALTPAAREILEVLKMDSPLSTKQLKRAVNLVGKDNESAYQRALKELWQRLLIVGYGEIDDGAFPSLAIGATQVIHENLWDEASALDSNAAKRQLEARFDQNESFGRYLRKAWSLNARDARLLSRADAGAIRLPKGPVIWSR